MNKMINLIVAAVFLGGVVMEATAAPAAGNKKGLEYSEWLFVQSDKALQRRMALEKMEGNLGHLRMQFRIKSDEGVHCQSPNCDGYVAYMAHVGTEPAYEMHSYHLFFAPSFTDGKIYTMEKPLIVELKTWPDGSRRYFDKRLGVVNTYPNGEIDRIPFFNSCVDFRLKDTSQHRCSQFDSSKAVLIK